MKKQVQSKSVLVSSGLNEQVDEVVKTKDFSNKKNHRDTFELLHLLQHISL